MRTLLILLLATAAHAQTPIIQSWHITTDTVTIAWQSPHTGPQFAHIVYAIATHDRADDTKKIKMYEVAGDVMQATIACCELIPEGLYYLGVQTKYTPNYPDYPDVNALSDIAWSKDVAVVDGGTTFGVFFAPPLELSSGLKLINPPWEP